MSKSTKAWLITAFSLTIIGAVIFSCAMTAQGWDFGKMSTERYETSTHEIDEAFDSISINTDTADIVFIPSENDKVSVICYEQENAKHEVSVKDRALSINLKSDKKWYEHINISFDSPKISIYLPKGIYNSLCIESSTGDTKLPSGFTFESTDIKASTGDISIDGFTASSLRLSVSTGKINLTDTTCKGSIDIAVSTGDVKLENITCKELSSVGDTGDLNMENVISSGIISIQRSTGDISFDSCDAHELFITTDTGDVDGSLLSQKVFFAQSDTGKVNVPESVTGGRCEIVSDTGDIRINLKK